MISVLIFFPKVVFPDPDKPVIQNTIPLFYNLSRISDCSFMKNSIVELMCHPGHLDAYYRDEISILESRFWKNMNLDIQLIDYSKLK